MTLSPASTGLNFCASRPSNPFEGDAWYDMENETVWVFIGTHWLKMATERHMSLGYPHPPPVIQEEP